MQIKNGIIREAWLGIGGMSGVITFKLLIDLGPGWNYWTFGNWGISQCRCEILATLLRVFRVDAWNKLVGLPVRAEVGDNPERDGIVAIGHITEDRWFRMSYEAEAWLCPKNRQEKDS